MSGGRPGTGEVSVDVLREAFDRSGLTLSEVARKMGKLRRHSTRSAPVGDTTYVRRLMGRAPHKAGGRPPAVRNEVSYDVAVRFVRACGHDPVDFGL